MYRSLQIVRGYPHSAVACVDSVLAYLLGKLVDVAPDAVHFNVLDEVVLDLLLQHCLISRFEPEKHGECREEAVAVAGDIDDLKVLRSDFESVWFVGAKTKVDFLRLCTTLLERTLVLRVEFVCALAVLKARAFGRELLLNKNWLLVGRFFVPVARAAAATLLLIALDERFALHSGQALLTLSLQLRAQLLKRFSEHSQGLVVFLSHLENSVHLQ